VTIGERPFHICEQCTPPHYDNCETCWGYGVMPSTIATSRTVPVPAGMAIEEPPANARPCPTCGSTVKGVPK
jgi:hypothetical protein